MKIKKSCLKYRPTGALIIYFKHILYWHDLPFSKGGASITAANVRILCARHNIQKSDKIE